VTQTAGTRLTPAIPPRPRLSVRTVLVETARRLRDWPEVPVTAVALALFSWRYTVPSPGWDEAITLNVAGRTFDEILQLSGNIDLVHVSYYLLVHGLLGGSDSLAAIRTVSVIAAALTACVLVRIGRQLESTAVGVSAGLLLSAAPLMSRYAQDARPYALVTLAAAGATLALLRVLRRPWLRSRWLVYGALLFSCGLLNLLSVFLVPAHLLYVLATTPRAVRRRWWATATVAVLALLPLALGAWLQRAQLSWLPHPQREDLLRFFQAEYAAWPLVPLLLAVALIGLRGDRGGRTDQTMPGSLTDARTADATHARALLLGSSWAVLPPVLLWTVALAHPLFDWRYVIFTLPGTALALGSLAPLLRRPGVVVLVAAVAMGGVHMQYVYRRPAGGHAEDATAGSVTPSSSCPTRDVWSRWPIPSGSAPSTTWPWRGTPRRPRAFGGWRRRRMRCPAR
jgi:mannosyltransferase